MEKSKKSIFNSKKYIYMEAIIYALLVIVVIYFSLFGPIYLKMVPLVFVMGIIGRIVFDRPIVTSLFGFCISLCIIHIMGQHTLQNNLIYSLYNFLALMLGEMAGMYIYSIYNSRAKKVTKKIAHNMSLAILTMFLGIFFNQYMNGDIVSYIKSSQKLYQYLHTNYPLKADEVKIESAKYYSGNLNYYSFTLSNLTDENNAKYNIGVYANNKIIDGYYNSYMNKISKELKDKFEFKYNDEKFDGLQIDLYYANQSKNIVLSISKNTDKITEKEIEVFSNQINNTLFKIKEFDEFNNVYKINALLKTDSDIASSEIYVTDFFNIKKYIESFDVEFFDI